jgi:FKBP-type peptidyl-prolyl cis-trans isomerase
MSMHLVRGMTSLNTRKQKAKNKSKRQVEAELEHARFLERVGVKNTSRDYRYEIPNYKTGDRVTSDAIPGNGNKKESMKYTGTLIKGIAVTHKSNLVPITSNEQAADVAKMRRQ